MIPHVASPALLFVISGPAGSGKTTLCDALHSRVPSVQRVVTSTTRPARPGERHAVDYYFFTEDEFEKKIRSGAFYEHARVHGRLYGTLREEIDRRLVQNHDILLNIDVQGAAAFRQAAVEGPLKDRLVSLFVMPPHLEELKKRLAGRSTDSEEEIARRLATAEREVMEWTHYDYCLISGTPEEDAESLFQIYCAEKMRVR